MSRRPIALRAHPAAAALLWTFALLPVRVLGASSPSPSVAAKSGELHRAVEVQGHRGARAIFPENTIPAFQHALDVGADVLELDVVATRDDVLVVTHDPVVDPERCVQRDGRPVPREYVVRRHSLAELRQLDCGRLPHPRFPRQTQVPGTSIPTLEEVFRYVERSPLPAARRVRFNIEAKRVPGRSDLTPSVDQFATLLRRVVQRHAMTDRVTVQSFDHGVLRALHSSDPRIHTAALFAENHLDMVSAARAAHADVVSPNHLWITAADVVACHRAGLRVIPWTANRPEEWQRLIDMSVDGIITDDPGALVDFLRERKGRNAHR